MTPPRADVHKSARPTTATLRPLVRASVLHFTQCVQTALMYRSSLAIFMATEAVGYAGTIAFWHGAATSNPRQQLYSPMALVLYFGLASFHHGIQHHAASRDVGSDIRLGKLSYAIIRPFPYLLQVSLRSLAFTLTHAMLLLPIMLTILFVLPDLARELLSNMAITSWWQYPLALLTGLVAGWVSRILIGLLAFDMSQIWGPDTLFISLYYVASGVIFPVDLLAPRFFDAVKFTPMYYMIGFPVLTILGRIPHAEFTGELTRGCVVIAVTALVVAALWHRGMRRFEAVGL
jgi:ABC-2 type transport system permease protein